MRNIVGMAALVAMILIPGFAITAKADPSFRVSINLGDGYSTCYADDDMDLDNVFVLDDSRIGAWVMLPSGRWVLRIRSMWWNDELDDWVFGPWYYDYNVAYNHRTHHHFFFNGMFHPVRFHVYMNTHYRPWHQRYYHHVNHRYMPRYSRHEDYRYHRYQRSPVIRYEQSARSPKVMTRSGDEHSTVIVRESKQPVRVDGGNRVTRIEERRGSPKQAAITRSRTITRENDNRGTTVTRTTTRRSR